MAMIRLIIVDDHEVVRKGLRGFLEMLDDFEIVGEGQNGTEAVKLATALEPDVILLDLMMPEMDGIEATREIIAGNPKARILILSSFIDEKTLFPALEAGASGFILKDVSPDDLADAIRDTARGQTRLHPRIAEMLLNRVRDGKQEAPAGSSPADDLTEREFEVLKYICRGQSNKEIADTMSISPMTVKSHVSNLLGKLGLLDRTQAAIYAIRNGLFPED